MSRPSDSEDWTQLWDARIAALENVLGKQDAHHLHGVIPFQAGPELGGAADVIRFRHHVIGIVYVTSELIGCNEQKQNSLGNFELMVCHPEEDDWGPWIIGQLAHCTLDTELNPNETMDMESAVPDGSTIKAMLFDGYAQFEVFGSKCGILLCLGLTGTELEYCHREGCEAIITKLKAESIYPFTDLYRNSVV
jgi:hypothetical protein